MTSATIIDFPCSICGKVVGYKELYPPGVPRPPERGPEHPLRQLDRYWHYGSDGARFGDSGRTADQFAAEVDALGGEHPASFMALYCRGCELVYCYDHLEVEYVGDPERTMGTCPKGHGLLLDW